MKRKNIVRDISDFLYKNFTEQMLICATCRHKGEEETTCAECDEHMKSKWEVCKDYCDMLSHEVVNYSIDQYKEK